MTIGTAAVPVAGIYQDLFDAPTTDFWCDDEDLFVNATSANTPPPALILLTDRQLLVDLAVSSSGILTARGRVPAEAGTLSVSAADRLLAGTDAAFARITTAGGEAGVDPRLGQAVQRARLLESGLRGPVVPVAVAGALLALVLVAAAGSYWADRRAAEVRLLAARGVGPAALAGKAALELALPALAGAALGWAASRLLIGALGPAPELDPTATGAAVAAGVAAFVGGLAAAATVAGLRARGTVERPLGAAPRWPAQVPWEIALLLAAGACWLLLEGRDAVVSEGGVAQVNGLLVAFPLLAMAGAAVLLARLLTALLPRLRAWAGRRRPPLFLAVNRWAAARAATATLLVAIALPVAVLGYTATLTASSRATLDAKIGVQLGAGAYAATASRVDPAAVAGPGGTTVLRFADAALTGPAVDRTPVQVLGIDPATFAGTATWVDSFAGPSLEDLVRQLTQESATVPVVAAGVPAGSYELALGSRARRRRGGGHRRRAPRPAHRRPRRAGGPVAAARGHAERRVRPVGRALDRRRRDRGGPGAAGRRGGPGRGDGAGRRAAGGQRPGRHLDVRLPVGAGGVQRRASGRPVCCCTWRRGRAPGSAGT